MAKTVTLDALDLATIVAALRYWQGNGMRHLTEPMARAFVSATADDAPDTLMDSAGIDALCTRINGAQDLPPADQLPTAEAALKLVQRLAGMACGADYYGSEDADEVQYYDADEQWGHIESTADTLTGVIADARRICGLPASKKLGERQDTDTDEDDDEENRWGGRA